MFTHQGLSYSTKGVSIKKEEKCIHIYERKRKLNCKGESLLLILLNLSKIVLHVPVICILFKNN